MRFIIFLCNCLYFFSSVISTPGITTHPNWKLVNEDLCGISVTDRIIGGKKASLGQFPWLVQIGYGSRKGVVPKQFKFRCGGALINRNTVLTAAHCVAELPRDQFVDFVRLGEHNTLTAIDCEEYTCAELPQDLKPKRIVVHNGYNDPSFKHDIALILLKTFAEYNGWVTPICLPHGPLINKNYVGKLAEVAGWGLYNISLIKPSTELLYVRIPVKDIELCVTAYKKYTTLGPEQLCVGGVVNEDSCEGDSGGPLSRVEVVDGSPRHYEIGLVSFGPKRCGSNVPAVYTNIAMYLEWILDNIEK